MATRRRTYAVERRVRRTLCIVCEGYAEVELVRHIRQLYLARSGEIALQTRNARGGGGRAALDLALSPRVRGAYDSIAIFVDTDKDWDDVQRQRARTRHINVLESSPCLESWLLAVAGHRTGGGAAQLKREFATRFGAEAHNTIVYGRHFPRTVLDAARPRVSTLDQLLRLIDV